MNTEIHQNSADFTSVKEDTLEAQILEVMQATPYERYCALDLTKPLNKPRKPISNALDRLCKKNLIERIHFGFYAFIPKIDAGALAELNNKSEVKFHDIGFNIDKQISRFEGYGDTAVVATELPKKTNFIGRTIKIVNNSKNIQVYCSTSENSLSAEGVLALIEYLLLFFKPYGIDFNSALLFRCGVNFDHCNLTLDGISEIKLHQFKNIILRIYNKSDRLRIESHCHELHLPLNEVINFLLGKSPIGVTNLLDEQISLRETIHSLTGEVINLKHVMAHHLASSHGFEYDPDKGRLSKKGLKIKLGGK